MKKHYFTFDIHNKSDSFKTAVLLGSLFNFDGAYDDPDVNINVLESSHKFLKRDLLSSKIKIKNIQISFEEDGFKNFDYEIVIKTNYSSGTQISKGFRFSHRDEDHENLCLKSEFDVEWDKYTHMEINIPAKAKCQLLFKSADYSKNLEGSFSPIKNPKAVENNDSKPIGIKKFAEDNAEHYELIKEAVKVYKAELDYLRDKVCDICDKELTDKELELITKYDFLIACEVHKPYRRYFNVDKVREELGIKPREISNFFD